MIDSIWIDSRAAQDPEQTKRGIGRFVLEHTRALVEGFPELIGGVVCDRDAGLPQQLAWLHDAPQVRYFDQSGPAPSILHVMSAFEPLWPRERLLPTGISAGDTRIVVTVYDLIPIVLPQYRLSGARASRYRARLQLLSRADHLLCISEFTAEDVRRVLRVPDERITVIGAGVTDELDTAITVAEATGILSCRFSTLRRGFPLYVGGADPRKNLETLVRAWAATPGFVRLGRPLVICGHMPPDRVEAITTEARRAGLEEHELLFTGYVSDLELAALYRSCGAFVFPSLYEGSGIPMLEAMAFGVPVVAANASTTPEILGDRELTFDPHDPADMARVIARALVDDRARARLKARSRARIGRFSWAGVARATIAGYERTLAAAPARDRRSAAVPARGSAADL